MPLALDLNRTLARSNSQTWIQTVTASLAAGGSGHANVFVLTRLPTAAGAVYRPTRLMGVAQLNQYNEYPQGPYGAIELPYLSATCVVEFDTRVLADEAWALIRTDVQALIDAVNTALVNYAPDSDTVTLS